MHDFCVVEKNYAVVKLESSRMLVWILQLMNFLTNQKIKNLAIE